MSRTRMMTTEALRALEMWRAGATDTRSYTVCGATPQQLVVEVSDRTDMGVRISATLQVGDARWDDTQIDDSLKAVSVAICHVGRATYDQDRLDREYFAAINKAGGKGDE